MSLRNAFHILVRKFRIVGSLAVYYIICFFIVAGAGYAVLAPTFKHFVDLNVGSKMVKILHQIFGGNNFFDILDNIIKLADSISDVISNSIGAFIGVWIFIIIVIGFLARFLLGLAELTACAIMQTYMSMGAKFSFFHMFFRNLGKNAIFQLQKILFTLPFDILGIYLLSQISRLVYYEHTKLLGIFLMLIAFIVWFSLRFALFSGWAPAIVTKDGTGFSALKAGIKATIKRFERAWGANLLLLSMSALLYIIVGIFTVGAGLIILIPTAALTFNILNMTVYYANTGRRYYIDKDTVFTPPPIGEEE